MAAHNGSRMYSLLFAVSLLLFQLSVEQVEKRHLYVKPYPAFDECPQEEVCLTLSEYLQNVSDFLTSNTAIHFLPGNHTLSSSEPNHDLLFAANVHYLSLFGYGSQNTILNCTEKLGFAITNAVTIRISNIMITNCGQMISGLLKAKKYEYNLNIHENTTAALAFFNVNSLTLQNVKVEGSHGYGLFGVDVGGNSNMTNCIFSHNGWKQIDSSELHSNTINPPGGNVLFVYLRMYSIKQHTLTISLCEFAHGIDTTSLDSEVLMSDTFFYTISGGSGLGILTSCSPRIHRIRIADSVFHHNKSPYGPGANMLLLYIDTEYKGVKYIDIFIDKCNFHDGEALEGGGMFVGSVSSGAAYPLIRVSNSTLSHNKARSGGGLHFMAKVSPSSVDQIDRVYFHLINCTFSSNTAVEGAGVRTLLWIYMSYPPKIIMKINILRSTFIQNTAQRSGGGIDISLHTSKDPQRSVPRLISITCTGCSFVNNNAVNGAAVHAKGCGEKDQHDLALHTSCLQAYRMSIQFYSTTISKNCHRFLNSFATLYIQNIESFELHNSNIAGNNGTAIFISRSTLIISGNVNVTGNHGHSGGGLYSDCQSHTYLKYSSQLYMANNTASYHGGAIFVRDCGTAHSVDCFIQIECMYKSSNNYMYQIPDNVSVVLENNTAKVAGNSIYGGLLETCYLEYSTDFSLLDGDITLGRYDCITFNVISYTNFPIFQIFKINNGMHSMSEVTSDPFKICFCDENFGLNKLDCVTEAHIEVYRGQAFHIPAVGVGQFNNSSPSIVRTVIPSDQTGELEERQDVQELGRICGFLYYVVRSSENTTQLQISVETTDSNINRQYPATIFVTFLKCPPGLELSSNVSICECEPHLKNYGLICDTGTWSFHRPASMWVGYYGEKQVVIHPNCPFHYCKSEDTNLSLSSQDEQCAFNHSGILCGACQQGLSLALGTSQCLKCSNIYLLLLIPFALAGVALVFLLLKCNLTVSVGSINGLIFYANIIQANQAIFFPHGAQGVNFCTKFLSVFIAWLNLDLGIQTCFFAGMDAYSKTWLQFLFPVYVWIMVGAMIYGSRYSPTIFRLIGSNAVPVLATLFLLSYAKLLRTVITAVYSTTLTGRDSSTPSVWLVDGNVQFFRGTHIALLLMAVVFILVYIVPFTLLVLLGRCLQTNSHYHKVLRKITIKLKPLLDAYHGPYKDRFRHWTGVMLLLRTILFAVFAGNVFGKPEINLFVVDFGIFLLFVYLWNAGRVYKRVIWNITESFYILNLEILTTATLLLKSLGEPSSTSQEIVTDIMVGTAFAVFCAIVLYHLYVSLRSMRLMRAVSSALKKDSNQRTAATATVAAQGSPSAVNVQPGNPSVSYINFIELREPLILCSDTEN